MGPERKSIAQRYSITARQLVDATLKIATANHYMVGFDADAVKDIDFDTYHAAYQLLIDLEDRYTRRSTSPETHAKYDLAISILAMACYRAHHTHLT